VRPHRTNTALEQPSQLSAYRCVTHIHYISTRHHHTKHRPRWIRFAALNGLWIAACTQAAIISMSAYKDDDACESWNSDFANLVCQTRPPLWNLLQCMPRILGLESWPQPRGQFSATLASVSDLRPRLHVSVIFCHKINFLNKLQVPLTCAI